jgi:hypothetical protein
MSIRSTESIVTFEKAFQLSVLDDDLPAGTYRIVFDDEEIAGLSFLAYRRVAAMIHIPSLEVTQLARQVIRVDSDELEAVIRADH